MTEDAGCAMTWSWASSAASSISYTGGTPVEAKLFLESVKALIDADIAGLEDDLR